MPPVSISDSSPPTMSNIAAEDVTTPQGLIPPDLFPPTEAEAEAGTTAEDVLAERFGTDEKPGWLAQAHATSDDAKIQKWAVYALAFRQRWILAIQAPSKVDVQDGGSSYTQKQIDAWGRLADVYEAKMVSAGADDVVLTVGTLGTGTGVISGTGRF